MHHNETIGYKNEGCTLRIWESFWIQFIPFPISFYFLRVCCLSFVSSSLLWYKVFLPNTVFFLFLFNRYLSLSLYYRYGSLLFNIILLSGVCAGTYKKYCINEGSVTWRETNKYVLLTRLKRLVHAGLVGKWHRDEVIRLKQSARKEREESQDGGQMNLEHESGSFKPLTLDHLQVYYVS